jgi:hypothetical protein
MWRSHHNGAYFAMRVILPLGLLVGGLLANSGAAVAATPRHAKVNCAANAAICAEVYDSEKVFGNDVYVGHDEPSLLFYSDVPGSGNNVRYNLVLPTDPSASNPLMSGKSYNFELHIAPWFGMTVCDTQSYPEQLSTCTPDSDTNISDPALTYRTAGQAYTELQFYPPGWAPWPAGISCDPTKWCAALNIDSLSENPVTGEDLNNTCANLVGVEYVNFAFVTLSGTPQPNSPPNPVNANNDTYTPNPTHDLFMGQGDHIVVTEHDTAHGLQVILNDTTSGQTGSMTASAANGFGQVEYKPHGQACNNIPYDFHPLFSTSNERTRNVWSAHTYNVAFSDEIGHFDYCTSINRNGGRCVGNEGIQGDREPADADDHGCFRAGQSTNVAINGCIYDNTGFDGYSYQPLWPDGNSALRPTPWTITSPMTGSGYSTRFSRVAFEGDQPRIEDDTVCDRFTGVGCTIIPTTDDLGPSGFPEPATFYPFFSTTKVGNQCWWQLGNHIPGSTKDFGQNGQWGSLLNVTYTDTGGHPTTRYNDFRNILNSNPC